MNSKILVIAAVGVIIVAAGVFLFVNKSNLTNNSAVTNETVSEQDANSGSQTNTGDSNSQTKQNITTEISLTSAGYEPSEITIKAGNTVVWTNNSGKEATVNSDPHPTHLLWPFLNLGN